MAEPIPGTLVDGRYKVISRLGSGGMADVYLAEDQQLGRKVALKLLHRRFAEDPGFVERFRREAQAAAGLQHPNVVSVYDRGSYDDTYYIVMEYLQGRTLKQLIREEAPLDPVRAIDITILILKAARFAHRRGVIHRDLKPHNVIVDEADQAKVTDFGIARAGASDMTETGSIMGTAQYLSPEQAQGHAVSAGSDLYSVAVVLYELLTGRVPFDAESVVTIALKHVSQAPTPPSAINPNVPTELEQVVLWALNKDASDRPTDADQFVAALKYARAAIAGRAGGQRTTSMAALVVATADVPPDAGAPTAGTPTAATHLVAGGLAPPLPPELPADGTMPPADAQLEEPPPARDQGPRRWPWIVLVLLLIVAGAAAAYLLTRPTRPLKVVVPTVVKEPLSVAQAQLQTAGFTPNLIYRADKHPSGTVILQQPLGGTKADQGSTVTLTVSNGPGDVYVPSVAGLTKQEAERAIRRAQLTVSRSQTESSQQIATGDATRTEPGAGVPLLVGAGVTLFISSGPAPVIVPGVTGQTQSAATATLTAANFMVATSTQDSTTVTPGHVISQSPSGGSRQPPGSTVTIVVAKAPAPVTATVPKVIGQTQSAATATLTAASFKVKKTTQDVTNQTDNGRVILQTPGGGVTATKGSSVTIVVGHYTAPTTTTTTTTTTKTKTSSTTTTTKTTT